jgi:hypothetical protein
LQKIGKALVMDAGRDQTLVMELMDLKGRLDGTIRECFGDNEKFIHGLQDVREIFKFYAIFLFFVISLGLRRVRQRPAQQDCRAYWFTNIFYLKIQKSE